MNKEAILEVKILENNFIRETQDRIEESFGEDCYKLKKDEELMNKIGDFGFGMLDFHTADIERLRTEKEFWKQKYLHILSLNINEIFALEQEGAKR